MKKKLSVILVFFCLIFVLSGCGALQKDSEKAEDYGSESVTLNEAENGAAFPAEEPERVSEKKYSVSVELIGGTGKVTVESPTEITELEDEITARVHFSSSNYDFMLVDEVRYDPVSTEDGSVFVIKVPDRECTITVQADTVAMSKPHLIEYQLVFQDAVLMTGEDMAGADFEQADSESEELADDDRSSAKVSARSSVQIPDCFTKTGELELEYANGFCVDHLEGGYEWITLRDGSAVLYCPEKVTFRDSLREKLPKDVTVLEGTLRNIYLVSSAAMDMFAACDAVSDVSFCGLNEADWYVEEAADAMARGELLFAGKYSAPDYELLRAGGCSLAIENSMVLHSPQVVEELRNLGIPVIIEQSSHEDTPQGRMEWIKLFGLLTGKETEANTAFESQMEAFRKVDGLTASGKKVGFFYVTTAGTVSVRNASDYIPKLIELAGGEYLLRDLKKDATGSTSTIQMEDFYAAAVEADYLIYNSSIAGEIGSLDDFVKMNPLFAGLRAVKEGNVFCTTENLYQSSMEMGDFLLDLEKMIAGEEELEFLFRLQ